MAKIPEEGPVSIAEIAAEWEGPEDLAELSKKTPLFMSGTEEVSVDDFRGKFYGIAITATGGTITDDGVWRYHTFTDSGAFDITNAGELSDYTKVDVLIVAAGGSQINTGTGNCSIGGCGAGGFVSESFTSSVGAKTVSVGGWANQRGQDSSVTGQTVAKGGGAGAAGVNPKPTWGFSGGSGGGAGGQQTNVSSDTPGYNGVAGQGNKGGTNKKWIDTYNQNQVKCSYGGGGGGGAGAVGGNTTHRMQAGSTSNEGNAGDGGNGKKWLNGVTYAGGGAGGYTGNQLRMIKLAKGGTGGGGDGTCNWFNEPISKDAKSATFYGGGAGGGHSASNQYGKAYGYQGIVIFRYRIAPDGSTRKAIPNHGHAPAFEPLPEFNPATHKATPNMIDDPNQETIGWTVVELTDEEKAAYAEAQKEREQMED